MGKTHPLRPLLLFSFFLKRPFNILKWEWQWQCEMGEMGM